MKHERSLTILAGGILGFFTAWGAAGCLISAFDLPLAHPLGLILLWGGAAVLSSLLLTLRRGGTMLLCLSALALGYVFREGTALAQLWQLCHFFSTVYNRAYGLGVLILPEELMELSGFDWPLGIWGVLTAMAVSICVCRQKTVWLPMIAALGPLCTCIVVTDTVPGELWLLMVMACLILLLLTSYVRQENRFQGLRLTAAAALPVVVSLLVLFLSLPQKDYVNQSEALRETILTALQTIPRQMEQQASQLAAGLLGQPPKQIDLAHLGPRIPTDTPVMEVTAETAGSLYLRQQDFDQYTGLGWSSTAGRQEVFPAAGGPEEIITISTRQAHKFQFLPYYPAVEASLSEGSLANRENMREYAVSRRHLPENWRQTAAGISAAASAWHQEYIQLPETTRREASLLLEGLYRRDASPSEKADLIAALVMDGARYDLDPGMMPADAGDFALWFLQEGERGYCVHFATAAAVLLRAAQIPARYVTGYLVEAQAGVPVTVTDEHAHAWAEYFEPTLGLWIPLEATPASDAPIPLVRPTAPTEQPVQTQPPPPSTEAPTEPSAPPAVEAIPYDRLTMPTESQRPAEEQTPPEAPEQISLLPLLWIPIPVLMLWLQRFIRLTLRRRRQRAGTANQQALARWQECTLLARLLGEEPPEELLLLAQKAKFSQHTLQPGELQRFDRFSRDCLGKLRQKPWYFRLVCQYIYAAY